MATNVLHEDGTAKDLRVEKLIQVSSPTVSKCHCACKSGFRIGRQLINGQK